MIKFNLDLLDKTATATIILLAGAIIGEYTCKFIKRILQQTKVVNKLKIFGIRKPIYTLSTLGRLAIYVITLIALLKLDIVEFFLDVLMILVLIMIIFGILFLIKDAAMNLYYNSKIKQKIKPGQRIKVARLSGIINKVSLGEIKITTKSNNLAIISKEFLAKNTFKLMRK